MADYETDEDEDNVPDLEENHYDWENPNDLNNIGVQFQGPTGVQGAPGPPGPQDPQDPIEYQLNEKKKEFDGSNNSKPKWSQCFYCTKYHPPSMHLPDMNYCGHCWGWLNSDQLKLTDGIYNGPNTIDEVKTFLKLTYPLHATTCVNVTCVYNKIKQSAEAKTLHLDFCILLGFQIENEKKTVNEKNNNTEYVIKKNKRYTKINYKLSSITI